MVSRRGFIGMMVGGIAAEAEDEESDVPRSKHQRVDDHSYITFTTVEGESARPDVRRFLFEVEVRRSFLARERVGEG